jgi:hypothetical protein
MQHFEPIWIWEKPAVRRAISDVERAAEWLLFFWPEAFDRTPLHHAARMACLEAHEGKASAEDARAAFRAAAEEAGITAPEPFRPGRSARHR